MFNYSKRIKKTEFTFSDSSSQINFRVPTKNQKVNNISFNNSIYLIKSEQKENSHKQYLIDFIRDNNNKSKKQNNKELVIKKTIKEKEEEKQNPENLDPNNFFNDYFYHQKKLEKKALNKIHPNEILMDIIDYLGEDALYPINIDIMNIKMNNFIPGKISSKSFGLINAYGANTNQGIDRNYNDDRVKIMINMNIPNNYVNKSKWPQISYFGIFDGHNGDHCAEFLRKNLFQYIYTNPNFPQNIEKAIKEGFINADKYYLRNYSEINNNHNINGNIPTYGIYNNSGSCGLVLLLVDTKIYIANVGDSRCLISCHNGKIQKDVTRDHKPEFPYEKQRIYSHGGNIYQNETIFSEDIKNVQNSKNRIIQKNRILLGPFRVNPGKLSVSRTFGDAKAKLEKLGGKPYVIIPEPDVYIFDYNKDEIDYFIMGCDGIFDRIKSFEIFKCVETIVENEKNLINNNRIYNNSFDTLYGRKINMNSTCGNVVDMILRLAMVRKCYDNVTCIMVAFKDLIFGKNISNNEMYNNKDKYYNNTSYKKNNEVNKDGFNTNNKEKNYIRLNKDIFISKGEKDNRKNISQENNRSFHKKIENNINNNININKSNNNYIFTDRDRKNKIYINDNKKENEINIQNNEKIQPQSQEKKIKELITLFSINNKKRLDNDNTSFLYNSYNSKNLKNGNDNNNCINNTQKTIYKNNILFNSHNIVNINNKNISSKDINKEKNLAENKNITISGNQKTSSKFRRIYNTKHFDIDKNIHKKIINKKITNLKMNSYCIADDIDSNINEEKLNLMNNQSYKIKSNSTENLYATPNKSEMDNRRITSRKIQRKTNDIFLQKNNLRASLNIKNNNKDNNNNSKQNLNNSDNNFFHHIILLSGNKKDNKDTFKPSKQSLNSNDISLNSKVNIRKINNSNLKQSIKERHNIKYDKLINARLEKNNKNLNDNLSSISSSQIIYTKKRKNK